MKRHRAILIIVIGIVVVVFAGMFFAPSLVEHIFVRSKKEIVRRPEDIENALLKLKNQKQDFNAPHLVLKYLGSHIPLGAGSFIGMMREPVIIGHRAIEILSL